MFALKRRLYSTIPLDRWISTPHKSLVLHDTISTEHLSDLFITLPTRDGSRVSSVAPVHGKPLPYGHHLIFFHQRNPEHALRNDGTNADFCPPEPFTRRMWAGGKMRWNHKNPLLVGAKATAISTVANVDKKNFDGPSPLVFVKQNIEYSSEAGVSIEEEKSHVYLKTVAGENIRRPRQSDGLPKPGFSFSYTPTPTTLFRFSALTFNGHQIHLDRDYAQKVEGYPERLVHGPLSALMLLETFTYHHPDRQLSSFDYRAANPLPVNEVVSIHGVWEDRNTAKMWAMKDKDGVVVMTGNVTVR